jgi:hypothetical protein
MFVVFDKDLTDHWNPVVDDERKGQLKRTLFTQSKDRAEHQRSKAYKHRLMITGTPFSFPSI